MAGMFGPAGRRVVVASVGDRRVGAGLEQRVDHVEAVALCGQVQGGGRLAVIGAAERGASVGVGAEVEQAADRRGVSARGGPAERGAAVDVGVDTRAARYKQVKRLEPVVAGRPRQRFVEDFLRLVGRAPGGKPLCGR